MVTSILVVGELLYGVERSANGRRVSPRSCSRCRSWTQTTMTCWTAAFQASSRKTGSSGGAAFVELLGAVGDFLVPRLLDGRFVISVFEAVRQVVRDPARPPVVRA